MISQFCIVCFRHLLEKLWDLEKQWPDFMKIRYNWIQYQCNLGEKCWHKVLNSRLSLWFIFAYVHCYLFETSVCKYFPDLWFQLLLVYEFQWTSCLIARMDYIQVISYLIAFVVIIRLMRGTNPRLVVSIALVWFYGENSPCKMDKWVIHQKKKKMDKWVCVLGLLNSSLDLHMERVNY